MFGLKNKRRILLLLIDVVCLIFSVSVTELVAYLLRKYTFSVTHFLACSGVCLLSFFAIRFLLRIYDNVWRYANSRTYLLIMLSDFAAGCILIVLMQGFRLNVNLAFTLYYAFFTTAVFNIVTLSSRFIYQTFFSDLNRISEGNNKIGVAIVGAGKTGYLLAQELMASRHSHYRPVCFVDTDENKIGKRVLGLRVYNETEIGKELKNLPVQEIFIALANIRASEARRLYDLYSPTGCKIKLYDFPMNDYHDSAKSSRKVIRDIRIEDLLFRESVSVSDERTKDFYRDKTVMVTGCGSIGSELCRQIAACRPKKLVMVDIYENNIYEIQQELSRDYAELDQVAEVASIRDAGRMEALFDTYRPEIVFHAAAHKHVPLMEHSSCEAIKNNVYGTLNMVDLAEKYGVGKFIFISTDKAVNPTNVMGATKRLCEMIIQSRYDSRTTFSAVRFGNVLGSNGSVIPLFRSQIAAGGPVTITDKRIIRYFMTIPEASQLVMQTGAMAKSGELFVLNMGNPVKIIDLAENLIRLSGYRPYEDIDIREIGLRPGEKLYEELLIRDEEMTKTDNDRIFIEKDRPFTREEIGEKLAVLAEALEKVRDVDQTPVVEALRQVVPTFCDPDTVNTTAIAEHGVNG